MRWVRRILGAVVILVIAGLVFLPVDVLPARTFSRAAGGGAMQDSPNVITADEMQVEVGPLVYPVLTAAVRDLPEYVPGPPNLDREMARKDTFGFIGPDVQGPPWHDPLVDLQNNVLSPGLNAFTTPLTNWVGMDYNSFPPDTTGDVGPNHIIQAVNGSGGSTIRIYNKAGTVLRTVALDTMAPSAPCNNGYCDPVVIYDSLADRWFVSEFASDAAYTFCLYVSTTSDPMGTWYFYSWDLAYYDYPKYGLWPDAYYMGYNGGANGVREVYAFDRLKMVAGQAATWQRFTVPSLSGFGFQLVVPASLEGPTPPPAGAPGIFARPRDTEVHGGTCTNCDLMEMWAFHVDWTTPGNSTLTKLPDVPMADYDCSLCGTGSVWDCMPQPNGQGIDPIREPIHYQLQYRNWGSYETLVGGFVEDVDGTDHAAVRWFEMRKVAGTWSMYQQGTVGGDAQHRSVTSVALDGAGGMAMGYTRTGASVPYYPSILYAGRRPWDPLNTMTYVDIVAQAGDSSQSTYDRWGDYSGIGVDPADDCTFYYTTEYMSGGSSATRVVSFRFDPDFNLAGTPTALDVCAPNNAVFTVTLAKTCALNGTVTMSTSGRPGGTTESWSTNPVTPPGSTTLTIGNTGAAAAGTYNVNLIGTAAGPITRQQTVVLSLQTAAPGVTTLTAPADGSTDVSLTPSFTWNAASGAGTYDLQVATDPAFSNIVISAPGLAGTSYSPGSALSNDTVYYWRVRASNACGGGSYSTPWAFRTTATVCRSYTGATGSIRRRAVSTFNLAVPDNGTIIDVNVQNLVGTHTNVGSLDFALDSPAATRVTLIPAMCSGTANFDKDLDDEAASALACPLSDGATQRPNQALSGYDGQNSAGTWVLRINNTSNTSGSLTSWGLQICTGSTSTSADYSDLVASYGIAWHTGTGTLKLGATWTADTAFAPAGRDDGSDDGVTLPNGWQPGQPNVVRVNIQGIPTNGRWLRVWFDWNGDGIFGDQADGERVYNAAAVNGDNDLSVNVPAGLTQPVNYRVRLYDSAAQPPLGPLAQDNGSYGGATGGEVEDGTTPSPTAVRLVSFTAAPAAGGVLVEWETASEVDNLGFNLYRSASLDSLGEQLNAQLIPSQAPGGGEGAAYQFLDVAAQPGVAYYYTLEDVDAFGARARHGPVGVGLWRAFLPVVVR